MHQVGDVESLTRHITMVYRDRTLLNRLRTSSLSTLGELTWTTAGERLLDAYRETIAMHEHTADRGEAPIVHLPESHEESGGPIKDAGASEPDADLPGCDADDQGENDRRLTQSDTMTPSLNEVPAVSRPCL